MSEDVPDCPHLPEIHTPRTPDDIHAFGGRRDHEFYRLCLERAHCLWKAGHAARAILLIDRSLCASFEEAEETIFDTHPLPYQALVWILQRATDEQLVGNPRVHYQHLASRLGGERSDISKRTVIRRWRAWGCWLLTRLTRPDLGPDTKDPVPEPDLPQIQAVLHSHGLPEEPHFYEIACRMAVHSNLKNT